MNNPDATIYLAGQRYLFEEQGYRSYRLFNNRATIMENRHPPGGLLLCNDETIAGGCSQTTQADEHVQVLVLPVTGTVLVNKVSVAPGEVILLNLAKSDQMVITNPYDEPHTLVNFMQLWFKAGTHPNFAPPQVSSFNINNMDALATPVRFLQKTQPLLRIGKLSARTSGTYQLQQPGASIMVMVLEGVFEVADRLLHERDALLLKGMREIDYESLSEHAILLITEV